MALPKCVDSFILSVLCGNSILKGAWITLLNSLIVRLSAEIDLLLLQITRINAANQILSLIENSLTATLSQVTADLNLFLGPLQTFGSCIGMKDINDLLQQAQKNKTISGFKKVLYKIKRMVNLGNHLSVVKKLKEDQVIFLQDFIDRINELCP